MTVIKFCLLISETILGFVLINLIQLPFRKVNKRILLFFLFILKFGLALLLRYLLVGINFNLFWQNDFLFAAIYLVLVSDIFVDIFLFVVSLFKKETNKKLRMIVSLIFTILFATYNIVNMQIIMPKYHTITDSKLKHEYKIVFFSDLHYGKVQTKGTVDKALEEIKQLKPDMLLLGGDITDEFTTKEEMEYIYEKIGSLNIPTYYVYGNHDQQESGQKRLGYQMYSEEDLKNTIEKNGITILCENYVEINDDLILIGRDYPNKAHNRKDTKDLLPLPNNHYLLCIDHSPYKNDDILELNADLQLSGHSHAGQLFPLQLIYRIMGLNVYGDYYIGDTHLYVSSGIAGWGYPLRSEAHCYYEVFNLKP